MKNSSWQLCLMAGASCLMLCGNTTAVFAGDDNPAGPDERLQRMERRINELAERQEQMMHRFGTPQEAQGQMMRRLGPPQDRPGLLPLPGPDNLRGPMPPT